MAPHRACGIGLLVAALASAPLPALAAQSPTELLTQGDAKASDGAHDEAARLYHEAYKQMSADERADMGELVVEAALESVRKAYDKNPDPALLELAESLMEDFESDMSGPRPEFIDAGRRWLDKKRPEPEPDAGDDGSSGDPDFPDDDPVDIGGDDGTDHDQGPQREIVGPVLIGAGGAVLITGIVLLAVGAPVGGNAEDARADALDSPEFEALSATPSGQPLAEQFRSQYDTYVDDETKRGRSLMIAGGVMLGVGAGLAVYGVVRLVQHRKKQRTSAIRVIPSGAGLTVRF
jgi:hypothetical protein